MSKFATAKEGPAQVPKPGWAEEGVPLEGQPGVLGPRHDEGASAWGRGQCGLLQVVTFRALVK